jgi:uncharacterized protein YjbI with pentapeptide repeats
MATKTKGRIPPNLDLRQLTDTFEEQLASGEVFDAIVIGNVVPPLLSLRGQSTRMDRCVWRNVTLADAGAKQLRVRDSVIENSDLANIDLTGSLFERVDISNSRLTGSNLTEAQLKSVLFRECKLDFAAMRMAKLQNCIFENCNLTDADCYEADLTGAIFSGSDFSRADISRANFKGVDLRDCRLDGLRGMPANMDGLIISPDQAALLITLFGVRVE